MTRIEELARELDELTSLADALDGAFAEIAGPTEQHLHSEIENMRHVFDGAFDDLLHELDEIEKLAHTLMLEDCPESALNDHAAALTELIHHGSEQIAAHLKAIAEPLASAENILDHFEHGITDTIDRVLEPIHSILRLVEPVEPVLSLMSELA